MMIRILLQGARAIRAHVYTVYVSLTNAHARPPSTKPSLGSKNFNAKLQTQSSSPLQAISSISSTPTHPSAPSPPLTPNRTPAKQASSSSKRPPRMRRTSRSSLPQSHGNYLLTGPVRGAWIVAWPVLEVQAQQVAEGWTWGRRIRRRRLATVALVESFHGGRTG